MLRSLQVFGREIALEGDESDTYLRDLPDRAPFSDAVLDFLGSLDDSGTTLTVVDVGANLGAHSLGLAARGPHVQVVAVEANPRTGEWLRRNAERNGLDRVRVVQRALGEQPGALLFCDNQEFPAGSMPLLGAPEEFVGFLRTASTTPRDVIEVPVARLDDLVEELGLASVDVVKIDVEGHDIRVLRGAERTVGRFRPVVVMEFATLAISLHAGMLPSDVLREVRDRFAEVYVLQEGGFLRRIATDADAIALLYDNAVHTPVQDLVCVPAGCPLGAAVARRVTDRPSPPPPQARLEGRIRDLEDELGRERVKQQALTEELDRARMHAALLERTVSWRITRPLRAIRRHHR